MDPTSPHSTSGRRRFSILPRSAASPSNDKRTASSLTRLNSLIDVKNFLLQHDEANIECTKFGSLKDDVTAGERMRRATDGEEHSVDASLLELRKMMGTSVRTGDAGASFSSRLETALSPTAKFRKSVQSVVLVNRLSSLGSARRTRVSFDSVILRDYEMTLGDQMCRRGPPVSLGWEYSEYSPMPIDEFELNHPERRPLIKLRIAHTKREYYLLHHCQITRDELNKALKANVKERRRRKSSEEAVDRARKKNATARKANATKQQSENSENEASKACCLVS